MFAMPAARRWGESACLVLIWSPDHVRQVVGRPRANKKQSPAGVPPCRFSTRVVIYLHISVRDT